MAKLTRLFFLLMVLGVLFACDGGHYHQDDTQNADFRPKVANQDNPETADNIVDFRSRLFHADIDHNNQKRAMRQERIWQRSEQMRAAATVSQEKYDYIVLPAEGNYRFYDRVTRLMTARWIAIELENKTKARVMSPELALRAIDKRATYFDEEKVKILANQVGAKVLHVLLDFSYPRIFPDAVHKGSIYLVLTGPDGKIFKFAKAEFEDKGIQLAETMFTNLAPTLVAAVVNAPRTQAKSDTYVSTEVPDFPQHIDDLAIEARSPLDHAIALQLIAMLTPDRMLYERRRLFERSLLALQRVDKNSPNANLLTARALFYLYRRPEALKYLSSVTTPAEEALREFLNGNYPELAALVPKINAPVLRAMAYLELKRAEYAYSKTNAGDSIALDLPTAQWFTVFKSAARDMDVWYAPDNVEFFGGIQGLFPQFDGDFRERLKGQVASGTYDPYGLNFSLLESIFDHAVAKGGSGCCAHFGSKLEPADIWSLYRNIAIANLLRKLDRATNIYGRYREATDLAEQLQPWLAGNTSFMALYANALYYYAKEVTGDKRTFVIQKALDMAADTVRYSEEVDENSYIGGWVSYQFPQSRKNHNFMKSCETWRCDFPSSMVTYALTGRSDALPYENLKFSLLAKAAATKKLDEVTVKEQLDTRFNGAPEKTPFLADRLIKSGQKEQAMSLLQHSIATNEAGWDAFKRLGDLLIAKGKYAEASETYMKFHDFTKPARKDAVLTSNRAYNAGRELYWRGHLKEAQPLFEVAARLNTGAGSQYTAIKYLALAGGDYRTAAMAAYQQGERYNDAAGYREYLTILRLVGSHDQAQAAFKTLGPRFKSPYLWASVFVGQRIENIAFEKVVTWTNTYLSTNDDTNQKQQAADYLTRQAVTDRRLSMTQLGAIARLETSTNTLKPGKEIRLDKQLGITRVRPCEDPATACDSQLEAGSTYMNYDYAGFLYAYALLQQNKFDVSFDAFLEYDHFHPLLDHKIARVALPYLAIAASESHNNEALAKLLPLLKQQEDDDSFYHNLTRAVIEADLGHQRESLEALEMAQRQCQRDDEWRPVNNWYELLQVAEWLHKKTGEQKFMDTAVTWAKEHTVIQPQDAWAYAFEAKYAKKSSDRIRAAAFAEYLDPNSVWLSSVPKDIRSRAHLWWAKHNPFKFQAEASGLKL